MKVFSFSVAAKSSVALSCVFVLNKCSFLVILRANVSVNTIDNQAIGDSTVAENFRKVAVHYPELARKVTQSIVESVRFSDAELSEIHPLILEYHLSENIYAYQTKQANAKWSSQPSTSWLHVLCNGVTTPYACVCNGVLSANVRFGRSGMSFLAF